VALEHGAYRCGERQRHREGTLRIAGAKAPNLNLQPTKSPAIRKASWVAFSVWNKTGSGTAPKVGSGMT
jgi:hypothetical protein